ncbi:P-loop containing nucleoside triphosphate hydrolase protein [Pelagophyceae sp. CCMP2097]|nr:P-loop containing nucleoside triphosphate hydrolase protein [Pelagophyceae sp. CCMP2097]
MENVRVIARIRPEPLAEAHNAPCLFLRGDRACDLVQRREEVYETARPLVLSATDGYNATIFAYGHTGSGKTFTMTGEPGNAGITPRAVRDIFETMERAAAEKDALFLVRVSYVELYNNHFRNLLDIEIRESKRTGVFLSGPGIEVGVRTEAEVRRLVRHGDRVRAHASTNCNEHSSRSHAILTIHVQRSEQGSVQVGKLHLVDLAGSERVSMSGARGEALVEAQNINLSLALLGDVLAALSRNATKAPADREPVPYRNSKLTHLLKDSLGGNSKTLMLANLRASPFYYRQSLVSLMYASRAREIRNRIIVNRANWNSMCCARRRSLRAKPRPS